MQADFMSMDFAVRCSGEAADARLDVRVRFRSSCVALENRVLMSGSLFLSIPEELARFTRFLTLALQADPCTILKKGSS